MIFPFVNIDHVKRAFDFDDWVNVAFQRYTEKHHFHHVFKPY